MPENARTPAEYSAEVRCTARAVLGCTGEGLPAYARRVGVSYSSLWRLLNGYGVRLRTLETLHRRIVEEGPATRLPSSIHYLGQARYLRARGFATAPILELRDLGPVTFLVGGPGSGKTSALTLLALGVDPLGPAARTASAALGAPMSRLFGSEAEVVAQGPAGRYVVRWVAAQGPDPVRVEVAAHAGGVQKSGVAGSLSLPAASSPSLVTYVSETSPWPSEIPRGREARRALEAAGFVPGHACPGRNARLAAAAAAALGMRAISPGLVLLDADFPPSVLRTLSEMSALAAEAGSQVVFAGSSAPEGLEVAAEVLHLRRSKAGVVRAAKPGTSRGHPGA